jgi:hypothetical protein
MDPDGERNREQFRIFEPGVATQMQKKWFKQPLDIGRSCVVINGPLDSIDIQKLESCNVAENLRKTDPVTYAKVFKIFAEPETGAFYLQKMTRYSAGPGALPVGNEVYLSKEQIENLIVPEKLNKMHGVKPAESVDVDVAAEGMSFAEMKEKWKYVYAFDAATA